MSQSSKPFAKKKPVPSTDSKNGFVLGGINQSFNNNSNQFQEISLQNLAVEKNQSFNDDEQEIVSPFMALSQERNSKSNSKILSPGNKNSRLRMQADTR